MQTELDETLDKLLWDYFTKGFTYLEIQEFLHVYHQQTIGFCTKKDIWRNLTYSGAL